MIIYTHVVVVVTLGEVVCDVTASIPGKLKSLPDHGDHENGTSATLGILIQCFTNGAMRFELVIFRNRV